MPCAQNCRPSCISSLIRKSFYSSEYRVPVFFFSYFFINIKRRTCKLGVITQDLCRSARGEKKYDIYVNSNEVGVACPDALKCVILFWFFLLFVFSFHLIIVFYCSLYVYILGGGVGSFFFKGCFARPGIYPPFVSSPWPLSPSIEKFGKII